MRIMVSSVAYSIYLLCLVLIVWSFNLEPRIPVIKVGDDNTYFGYSVAQHIILSQPKSRFEAPRFYQARILVGAPRDHGYFSDTNHSGAIYSCPLSTTDNDCEKLNFEEPVTEDELKDDQWLGVTLKSQGPGGFVMACAHRYVRKGATYRWGNGICYSLSQNLDYIEAYDPCLNRPTQKAHEQYGYCQAGTSGTITQDNSIVIGTPGPFTWKGTVFINSIVQDDIYSDISWYMGPVLDQESPVEKYSYLGMAVTSGKFFKNKMTYVAGAPRANNVGQVIFFTKANGNTTLAVKLILSGELFASSFGYELASADLNNDNYPDLIVGAPFYYGKDIGGAIYVYMNSETGINGNTVPQKITGKPDSRFGFAIANCSDLNKDGYEDVAVGAPYENNGVVYIYLGSRKGIDIHRGQVIKAEELPITIRTFGHSLSGGLDLDQNNYPDLVVGAYEENTVVMLRARPIISIKTTIEPDPNEIIIYPTNTICDDDKSDIQQSCITFRTCFEISPGERLDTDIHINYTIEAETFVGRKTPRMTLRGANNQLFPNIITKSFAIRKYSRQKHCEHQVAYLRPGVRDLLAPVQFKLAYSLVQERPLPVPVGRPLPDINRYPILNQEEASKIFAVNFEKECGDDDICESDLQVKASLYPEGTLILGEVQNVTLEITIFNRNESAYEAAVYITHSESLSYIQGKIVYDFGKKPQGHCDRENNTLVICRLDNPFKKLPEPTLITISFNPSKVQSFENQLHLIVKTNSTSKEKVPKPDLHFGLNVIRRARLTYDGKAFPEQVPYGGEIRGASAMKTEEDVGTAVIHKHKITNYGPSSISSLTLHIGWPYEVENRREHGKFLLYLTEEPTFQNVYGFCNIDRKFINHLNLTLLKTEPTVHPRNEIGDKEFAEKVNDYLRTGTVSSEKTESTGHGSRRETETRVSSETYTENRTVVHTKTRQTSKTTYSYEESSSRREKRDTSSSQSAGQGSSKKTIIFDCNRTAKCLTFQCTISNLWAATTAVIQFKSRLWNSTFVMDYPDVHTVQIVTSVTVEVDPLSKVELTEPLQMEQKIVTTAIPDIPYTHISQEIPYWVYILAACIGILLLVLLVLCLWKIGFFKRKKPDEMMKGNLEKRNMNSHDY